MLNLQNVWEYQTVCVWPLLLPFNAYTYNTPNTVALVMYIFSGMRNSVLIGNWEDFFMTVTGQKSSWPAGIKKGLIFLLLISFLNIHSNKLVQKDEFC